MMGNVIMSKKKYLIGISTRCDRVIKSGIIKLETITGLFDNCNEKWGLSKYDFKIEQPRYIENAQIIVTAAEKFHIDIVSQLLELGFSSVSLVLNQADGFQIKELDFSLYNMKNEDKNLILLFLQHRSYSGISAIEYMVKNELVNTYGFRVKLFSREKKDEEYYFDLARAKYFITERDLPIYSERIKTIQLWHGFPLKCMGTMDAEFDCSNRENVQLHWNRYDFLSSYGLNYTTFISACFGTVFNKFIVTGMPRNDLLFCTDGRKNIEIKFPKSRGKKIVFYMPTFREISGRINGNNQGYIFYWPEFEVISFERFCEEHNLFFIFKLHPSDSSKVKEWCYESDNMGILTDELLGNQCTYEFLNGVDTLLTDYSSVYFDFLLLNKPIIFTNRDERVYIKNRGVILEPLDFWRPGPIVNNMDDLEKELKKVSEGKDDYRDKRKELIPFVHKHTDGNSTQRLLDFIRSL